MSQDNTAAELEAAEKKIKELQKENTQYKQIQSELTEKLNRKEAEVKTGFPVVVVEKKKYTVHGSVSVDGTVYSAVQLSNKGNEAVCKKLIESGSEILKPVK